MLKITQKYIYYLIGIILTMSAVMISILTVYGKNADTKLIIPEKEAIIRNGYPRNQDGKTYGPDIKNLPEPDLALAVGNNGVTGYVKTEDVRGPIPDNPEEAVQLNSLENYSIPLYLQDGETIIGEFTIETGSSTEY